MATASNIQWLKGSGQEGPDNEVRLSWIQSVAMPILEYVRSVWFIVSQQLLSTIAQHPAEVDMDVPPSIDFYPKSKHWHCESFHGSWQVVAVKCLGVVDKQTVFVKVPDVLLMWKANLDCKFCKWSGYDQVLDKEIAGECIHCMWYQFVSLVKAPVLVYICIRVTYSAQMSRFLVQIPCCPCFGILVTHCMKFTWSSWSTSQHLCLCSFQSTEQSILR